MEYTAPEEGVIQFHHQRKQQQAISNTAYKILEPARQQAFRKKWIGVYPDGVAYGNLSCRLQGETGFYITASQTGSLSNCLAEHYCHIHDYNYQNNQVSYSGCRPPSSESLTHAMFYELDRHISCVLHIHHAQAWKQLKYVLPTSHEDVTYGTIEMAMEIKRLFHESSLQQSKILVMAGHEDGIISFAEDMTETFAIMQQALTNIGL